MKSRISSGKKETRARQTSTPACGQCRYSHYYKKTPIFHLYHASVALERYASLKSMHLKMQEVRVLSRLSSLGVTHTRRCHSLYMC